MTLVTCGGTCDKVYPKGRNARDMTVGPSYALELLKRQFPWLSVEHIEVCRKDSLDMDRYDFTELCAALERAHAPRVLVTAGTDKLVEIAQLLVGHLPQAQARYGERMRASRVVLVGASQPACLRGTDADVRFSFAIGALFASVEPRIIVAMDGLHVDLATLRKGEDGVFRST